MKPDHVEWPGPVNKKLRSFYSDHFTAEESYDFITQLTFEVEDILLNNVISKRYAEEYGEFRGVSRLVVRKFKVYFEWQDRNIMILSVKFPGEN